MRCTFERARLKIVVNKNKNCCKTENYSVQVCNILMGLML